MKVDLLWTAAVGDGLLAERMFGRNSDDFCGTG